MYEEFYTFLGSADCKDYFPHNNPSSFYVKPPNPFSFPDGQWEVALCELKILGVDDKSDGTGRFLLCCDLIRQSVVGGDQFPVLYEIALKKGENRIDISVENRMYFNVSTQFTEKLRMYIYEMKTEGTSLASKTFGEETRCTLHFRQHDRAI